jgi:S1-C subfamily serine protease
MQITLKTGADAGKEVAIPNHGAEFTIGRNASCSLVLNDPKASSRHASIRLMPNGTATLSDLGSTNGTFVNGRRVTQVTLTGNDQFQIGDTLFTTRAVADGGTVMGRAPAANVAPAPPASPPPTAAPPARPPVQQPAQPGAPNTIPVQRPSRTYSAIQRMQVIRSTRRAMYVGIALLVVVLVGIGLGLAGVYGGGGDDKQKELADVVDDVKGGITYVRTEDAQSGSIGRGTAWVWNLDQGLLVTNEHVTHGAVTGIKLGVGGEPRDVQIVGQAPCEDLAVLRVQDTSGLQQMKIGDQSKLRIGTPVAAVGYPGPIGDVRDFDEYELNGTDGTVSKPHTHVNQGSSSTGAPLSNIVSTTATINSGQSGGPLVNYDGEVVGVTSLANFDDKANIEPGAIGIDRVKEIVPKLAAGLQVC